MTFTMDDNGKLLNVDFVYRNRMDDGAKDCMRDAAEALKFPPSLRGKQTGTIVFTPREASSAPRFRMISAAFTPSTCPARDGPISMHGRAERTRNVRRVCAGG